MNKKQLRLRRRRRLIRGIRRMAWTLLLMPGKMPPIDFRTVETCMRACEAFGVLFVLTLIARLSTASTSAVITTIDVATGTITKTSGAPTSIAIINTIIGIIFAALLIFLKLADHQDKLVRMRLANYIYIR